MRIAVTGGGTGGHIYPAVAVLDELRKLAPGGISALWIGTANRKEAEIVPKLDIPLKTVEILPLRREISLAAFKNNAALASSLISGKPYEQAARHLLEFEPDCLISTGGYVAYPACRVASKLDIPLFLIEPNSVPGLTTLKTAKYAAIAFCASDAVTARLSRFTSAETVGVPVRSFGGSKTKAEILANLGLENGRRTIVVTGGSLGAQFVNKASLVHLAEFINSNNALAGAVQVLHQTGARGYDAAMELAAEFSFPYKPVPYIEDTPEVLSVADVLIGRSGASTVAEAAHFGLPAIFFPYAHHKDNQQILNAMPLAEAGVAFIHFEYDFNPADFNDSVRDALTGSANPEFRKRIKEFDRRAAATIANRIGAFFTGAAI